MACRVERRGRGVGGEFPYIDDDTSLARIWLARARCGPWRAFGQKSSSKLLPAEITKSRRNTANMTGPSEAELVHRKVCMRPGIRFCKSANSVHRSYKLAPKSSATKHPPTSQGTGQARTMSGTWSTSKTYALA
jgi:hypothetical protein